MEHHPDYPPKTPPPPKRPVQPPRPTPDTKTATVAVRGRHRMNISNRRAATWGLESAPWTVTKARTHVVDQLHTWGYREVDEIAGDVTALLIRTAVDDGGKRVSLHLADQRAQALIVVLSHRTGLAVTDEQVLPGVAALGASSCGADTAEDGRRLWAVLDL
ncbi:hypothetical protein [Streptomyces sp. NBC_01506]|uniref:hypothetical protein n=1 Tax=Streptomyces sp. NBC_01506 TaxID=2903887 RepID=UPI00386E7389